jgi:AbrB family looped-hinge helix DNA binding protein
MDATIVMGKQGRVVIPADIRAQLGLAPGDQLHLHLSGTRLVIERPEDAVRELRQLAAAISPTRSLVEELLADRRADMKLE